MPCSLNSVSPGDLLRSFEPKREAQIIPVEAYVKSEYDKSPYARIGKGDKISAEFSLRQNNYTGKDGNMVYSTVVFVESIQFEESVAVTAARHATNAAQATAAQAAAAPVAPAPVPAQVQA